MFVRNLWYLSLFFIASGIMADVSSSPEQSWWDSGIKFLEKVKNTLTGETSEEGKIDLLPSIVEGLKSAVDNGIKLLENIKNKLTGETSEESKIDLLPSIVEGLKSVVKGLMPKPNIYTQYYMASSQDCEQYDFCKIGSDSNLELINNQCCGNSNRNNTELKVLIHGFSRNYKEEWIQKMKDQLLKESNTTVIAINWQVQYDLGIFNNTMLYEFAFDNIGPVIEQSAKFLSELTSHVGKWKNIHILGHSMGAHIAGKIAETLKTKGIRVNRVTGLDPALPCFKDAESKWSLNKDQANFVDVIHSNSDSGEDSTFGIYRSLGHVDIYPNNGDNQKGCNIEKGPLLGFKLPGEPLFSFFTGLFACGMGPDLGRNLVRNHQYLWCNHFKAPEFMILSMKNEGCKYWAVPEEDQKEDSKTFCEKSDKCVKMGIKAINTWNKTQTSTRYYIDMHKLDVSCLEGY